MFKFLKDKLKGAVDKFSKGADEESDYVEVTGTVDEEPLSEENERIEVQDDYVVVSDNIQSKEESDEEGSSEDLPVIEQEPEKVEEEIAVTKEDEFVPISEVAEDNAIAFDIPSVEEKTEVKDEILVSDEDFIPVDQVEPNDNSNDIGIVDISESSNLPTAEDLVSGSDDGIESALEKDDDKLDTENVLEDLGIVEKKAEDIDPVKETIIPNVEEQIAPIIINEPEKVEEVTTVSAEESEEIAPEEKEFTEDKPKMGFFKKLLSKKITEDTFEDLFFDLEVTLLENNVATEVIDKIKDNLKTELVDSTAPRGSVAERVSSTLENTLKEVMSVGGKDLLELCSEHKPLVVCFFGINGAGKTTSIGKLTRYFQNNGKSVVLAAADTFRAAAIDQLQEHADALGVKMIKHDYGSDPAAVAFDAVEHAKAKDIDVVLIDTAGRLHNNSNLMQEMEKIIRVAKPHQKIFVGESITGNDCVEQAKKFDELVGIDGIILSKADIDEKGGAALSISYVTGKPILYLGVGQGYDDLERYDRDKMLANLM